MTYTQALSVTLVFALCSLFVPPLAAQKYLRAADKQFEIGAYREAIPGFERHLRKDSDADDVRARLAHAYRMTGQLEAAAVEYAQLTAAADPEHAFRQALVLMELGRYGEAVEALARAQQLGYPGVDDVATRLEYAQRNADERSSWRVSNEFANSPGDDFAPAITDGGVVFASSREGLGEIRLYRSTRDENDFLRVPTPLHSDLKTQVSDAPVAYAPGSQLVAYTRNNFDVGERFLPEAGWELNIQLATADDEGDFSGGQAFPYNGPGFSTGFAAFSIDGERVYFASDRPGGQGGYDLYVSVRTAEGWGDPKNLGPRINTPGNEITPTAVEGSLYFASDYHPGYGGMDVYRADLVGDAAAAIVNLGADVNSPLDDVGFVVDPDGEIAYFASNRSGGKGGLDLYRAVRSGTSLRVEVVDARTGQPVPNAVLNFTDCGQGKYLTGVDGTYSFKMLSTESCRPTILKPGYEPKEFTLDAARLREGQGFKLRLNPEDKLSAYAGRVITSRGGGGLAGARVAARQVDGGYVANATTDSTGAYNLELEVGQSYVISYSAEGMADLDREIALPADGGGGDPLGSFAMFPASPLPESDALASNDTSAASALDVLSEAGGPVAEAEAPSSPDPAPAASAPTSATPGAVAEGWAVQVAALAIDATDISEYQTKLARYGTVYGKRENGVLRVRVGPFVDRDAAVAQLGAIRAEGYADAFPAPEPGGEAVGIDRPVPMPARDTTEDGKIEASGTVVPRPLAPGEAQSYMIRLATYGNFANFDAGSVAGLGRLTTRRRGDYVIVLLEGYPDLGTARARIDDARAAGFEDAHVVFEAGDGTLRKL